MSTSYNGWTASENLDIRNLVVAGVEIVPGVRNDDDVYVVLQYVATQFHERVEKLVPGWCWGYNFRLTTNDTSLSNHSSGTAMDLNAPNHPFNVPTENTFSSTQIDTIHQIINVECKGLVEWGGDYRNTQDGMHFDIKGTKAQIAVLAQEIRNGEVGEEMKQEDFDRIRAIVKDEVAKGWQHKIEVTNAAGKKTKKSAAALTRETWQKLVSKG